MLYGIVNIANILLKILIVELIAESSTPALIIVLTIKCTININTISIIKNDKNLFIVYSLFYITI